MLFISVCILLELHCLSLKTAGIALTGLWVGGVGYSRYCVICTRAFNIELACATIIRKCSTKMAKHAAVMQVARPKLNTVNMYPRR